MVTGAYEFCCSVLSLKSCVISGSWSIFIRHQLNHGTPMAYPSPIIKNGNLVGFCAFGGPLNAGFLAWIVQEAGLGGYKKHAIDGVSDF